MLTGVVKKIPISDFARPIAGMKVIKPNGQFGEIFSISSDHGVRVDMEYYDVSELNIFVIETDDTSEFENIVLYYLAYSFWHDVINFNLIGKEVEIVIREEVNKLFASHYAMITFDSLYQKKDKMLTDIEKIEMILSHMHNVEENCIKLGKKLIQSGEIGNSVIGRHLIKNARLHDVSKLEDVEFKHLFEGDEYFEEAISIHRKLNRHHPEAWVDIHHMPALYIAEMVCDCAARSSEFGTDIRKWFFTEATKIYGFKEDDVVGQAIKEYLDLLLTKSFKRVK